MRPFNTLLLFAAGTSLIFALKDRQESNGNTLGTTPRKEKEHGKFLANQGVSGQVQDAANEVDRIRFAQRVETKWADFKRWVMTDAQLIAEYNKHKEYYEEIRADNREMGVKYRKKWPDGNDIAKKLAAYEQTVFENHESKRAAWELFVDHRRELQNALDEVDRHTKRVGEAKRKAREFETELKRRYGTQPGPERTNVRAASLIKILQGFGVILVVAGGVCALLEWQTNIFHKDPVVAATQRQALIKAGSQSPQKILEARCKELEAAATMIEGHAYDTYSIKEYYSLLDSIRTIYGDAYDQATTSGIANSTQLILENGWIPTAPPPVAPFTPVHASEEQVKKMAIEHEEAQDLHTAEQYLNQIRQEFEFTQQHHKNVHEAAFYLMRGNMTGLSFDADSHQFKIAYIGMYSRMAIPRQCFPYIDEGKVTTERFADLRADQAIQLAKTDLAFDSAFEAKSNLPPTPVA